MLLQHLQGKKRASLTFVGAVIGFLFIVFSTPSFAKTFHVAIISSGKTSAYKRVIDIIKDNVTRKNKLPVSFKVIYVDDLASRPHDLINHADLLLAIGQRAMLTITERERTPPIVVTLVTQKSYTNTLPALKTRNKNVSAVFIDSPVERQIYLANLLLGPKQTVGLLLSDSSSVTKKSITTTLKQANLSYKIQPVSQTDNIIRKLTRVISKSDALIALPDPLIFNRNTARNILLTTYRQRIPVIGYSANYVKAGALAAVASTPLQIATQTSKIIIDALETRTEFPSGGHYPEDFDVFINYNVARSLNINAAPASLLKNKLKIILESQ